MATQWDDVMPFDKASGYMHGKEVRLHPASDWFMRGITRAVCTSAHKGKAWKYFKPAILSAGYGTKLRIKLTERDVLLDEEAAQ